MRLRKVLKEYENVEAEFFEISSDKRSAIVNLKFSKFSDICDANYISKQPILSDEFYNWLTSAIDIIPSKYKIDVNIYITDLEGYTEEEIKNIFIKNIILDARIDFNIVKQNTKIALLLILFGIIALILTVFLNLEEAPYVLTYTADIITTVLFWEAAYLLIVERIRATSRRKSLRKRFEQINFYKGGKKDE